jgi:hypothetical protein
VEARHCHHAHETGRLAESLDKEPRYRRAERRADPGNSADETLGEVKSAGAFREIGDDQRRQHAERGARQAVQHLDGDEQCRGLRSTQKPGADRNDAKSNEEKRPASPAVSGPSRPGREQRCHDLWGAKPGHA